MCTRKFPSSRLAGLALVWCLTGCQSYGSGLAALCDAPIDCASCAKAAPDMRQQLMAQHVEKTVHNREVLTLVATLAELAPEARAAKVREAAKEAGLPECKVAEVFLEVTASPPGPGEPASR